MTSINQNRVDAVALPQPLGPVQGVVAPEAQGPSFAADSYVGTARPTTAQGAPFSLGRAFGHFFQGFGHELVDMAKSVVQHPFQAAAMIGAGWAVVAAAPLIGVTAATAGLALAGAFALYGAFRMGQGAARALGDYRAGNSARAEADFELIGRGGLDVATALAPVGLARGLRYLRGAPAAEVTEASLATKLERPVAEPPAPKVVKPVVTPEQAIAADARVGDWRGMPTANLHADAVFDAMRAPGGSRPYVGGSGEQGIELTAPIEGGQARLRVFWDPEGSYTAARKPVMMIEGAAIDDAGKGGVSFLANRSNPAVQATVDQALARARVLAVARGDGPSVQAIDRLVELKSKPPVAKAPVLTELERMSDPRIGDYRGTPPASFTADAWTAAAKQMGGAEPVTVDGSPGVKFRLRGKGFDGEVKVYYDPQGLYTAAGKPTVMVTSFVKATGANDGVNMLMSRSEPEVEQAVTQALVRARTAATASGDEALVTAIDQVQAHR